jgi:hypothetical protein
MRILSSNLSITPALHYSITPVKLKHNGIDKDQQID